MEQIQQSKEADNQTVSNQNKSTKTIKAFSSSKSKNAIQAKQSGIPPKPTKQGQLPAKATKQGAQPVLQAKFGKVLQRKPLDETGDPPKKHKVKKGEGVYGICIRYKITQEEFKYWNGLSNNDIKAGLEYFVSPPSQHTVKSKDNLTKIARLYRTSVDELKKLNNLSSDAIDLGQVLKTTSESSSSGGKTNTNTGTNTTKEEPANTGGKTNTNTGTNTTKEEPANTGGKTNTNTGTNTTKEEPVNTGGKTNANTGTNTTKEKPANTGTKATTEKASSYEDALKKDITFTESAAANTAFTSWKSGTVIGNTTDPTKVNIKHLISLEDRLIQVDKGLLGAKFANAKLKALKDKAAKDLTADDKKLITAHVTSTIAAVKKFQTSENYNVKWFSTKKRNDDKTKYVLSDTTKALGYTEGQVKQGDATYVMLRDIRRYSWKFNGADGKSKTVKGRNFKKSWATTYEEGTQIYGSEKPANFDVAKFKEVGGMNDKQAKAMKYASSHEGKFDAINTYDKAVISFGYVQFAGGGYGTFTRLMAYIKKNQPTTFKEKFQKYGIDVSYSVDKNKNIKKSPIPSLIVNTDKKTLKGIAAEKYIKDNPKYVGVFLQAGQDTKVKEEQIRLSVDDYATPTENTKLGSSFKIEILKVDNGKDKKPTIKIGADIATYKKTAAYKTAKKAGKVQESDFGDKLSALKLKDILTSEKELAGLYSLMVNTPTNTKKWFKQAILIIIKAEGLTTIDQVKAITAKRILKKVKALIEAEASGSLKSKRTMQAGRIKGVLNSKSLGTEK